MIFVNGEVRGTVAISTCERLPILLFLLYMALLTYSQNQQRVLPGCFLSKLAAVMAASVSFAVALVYDP